MNNFCACGCGQLVKEGNLFVHGGHYLRTPRGKIIASQNGRQTINRPDVIAKMRAYNRSPKARHIASELGKRIGNSPENLARLRSPERRKKQSQVSNRPENIARLKANASKATNSPKHIAFLKSDKMRAIVSETNIKLKKVSKLLSGREHPSKLEQRVFALIYFNSLPYDFVGDGKLLIGEPTGIWPATQRGYKCPDFVHRSEKTVVEVADEGDKKSFQRKFRWSSKEDYERDRLKHFSYYGWQVLFLWSDMSDEEMISILNIPIILTKVRS